MVRDYSIDSVKGVCLSHMFVLHIFIIYGFFDAKGAASEFYFNALSFFMSSFYFFSGFFFKSPENGNEMKYIRSKVKKFIIPLITWSVISLPFVYCKDYLLTNINTGVKWLEPFTFVLPLGCLRSNDALWFLSSLFLVNVIFFIVNRRLSGKRLFVFILLCYLYSFVDSKILPCVFNSSNVSLGIVYFYGGYMFRKASMKYSIFRVWYFILACVLYVLIMTFDPQYLMFVSLGQVKGYYILNLVFSISGIYILWFVFKKLPRISLFVYFGEHSMSLYVWHMIPLRLVLDPLIKYYYPECPFILYFITMLVTICLTAWIIEYCLGRKFSILLGY